ncbi:hypothetical protein BDV19DRAFT_348574 [Aspergillus venezuelensis]
MNGGESGEVSKLSGFWILRSFDSNNKRRGSGSLFTPQDVVGSMYHGGFAMAVSIGAMVMTSFNQRRDPWFKSWETEERTLKLYA